MATLTSGRAVETFAFEHPILGSMTGVVLPETPDVVRFRAIPYARHPGRFEQSVLRENLDGHSRDFTKPGYACPHKFDMTDIYGGGPHPGEEPIQTSESESLILDLNVPRSQLESVQKGTPGHLPVMSYIHGGAFVLGKIDATHDTAHMVQHSVDISKPVITTGIQYRLGALGFLVTPDGEKNFGLWDQRNAMLWTQRFIEGFGGDKHRVTMFGESAGGYSICCHMLSHLPPSGPLFNRAIIMSGVPGPMLSPLAEDDAIKAFDTICEGLGIEERGKDGLEKLRALDVETVFTAGNAWTSKGNRWHPVQDDVFFNAKVTWDQAPELLASCDWVNELIVGNVGFEGVAYPSVADLMSPSIFQDHMRLTQSEEATQKVMEAYKIDLSMDQNLFVTSALRWLGDIFFDAPNHIFTKHVSSRPNKKVYRYIFDIRSPFPKSPYYQQAHHWVDVYFVFRTMQFRFPYQYLKDISDQHAAKWIAFANGEDPWKQFEEKDGGIIMIADDREGWVEKTLPEYEKMSGVEFSRLDALWEAWLEKKGEKWSPFDLAALKK